ncbi:MAG: alginate O-acetyltransferase AlgX-related protein [Bordetella sp.]|uniref:alginate O-acetyltransferase AlgX-related protein n=1 Tax=Bordetella sp. TaxID=28081 RepID=UPI003F7CA5D4
MQAHTDARRNAEHRSFMRVLNRFAAMAVFFGLLLLPIAWFGRASFAPRTHENRRLEAFPRWSIHWAQDFERWFSDRYGMRDALVYYGSRLQMARTGMPMNQQVVVGRDNWLFYDENYTPGHLHFASLYGKDLFLPSDLKTIADNLSSVRQHLAACRIPFYLVIAPDKQTVYPEKLLMPPPPNAVTQADQLEAYLQAADPQLRIIDLRKPEQAAKAAQTRELYYRTDTHWNELGAFFGYQAIAKRLMQDGVLANAVGTRLDSYRIRTSPSAGGDIAVNLLDLPGYFRDHTVQLDNIQPRQAHDISLPGWPQDINNSFRVTENPVASGSLLLYRDSFFDALTPFVAENFHRIYSFLGRGIDGDRVRQAHPNVVMLEIVERGLRHLVDHPVNLASICE